MSILEVDFGNLRRCGALSCVMPALPPRLYYWFYLSKQFPSDEINRLPLFVQALYKWAVSIL
jgi:hypothetical protein